MLHVSIGNPFGTDDIPGAIAPLLPAGMHLSADERADLPEPNLSAQGWKVMKLTPAHKRALEAVQRGECERRYHAKGNTLHGPKGMSARTLWQLADAGLIDDLRGGAGHRFTLGLTVKGGAALARITSDNYGGGKL